MKAINWNRLEDVMDKAVYEKLTEQFWLSTRIPLSNDLDDWRKLSEEEKSTINRAFAGLTMLDTLQSEVGAVALIKDSKTQHEKAVYANIHFMEAEHARSYSSIFTTFNTPTEIDQIFEWSEQNELLQKKAAIIEDIYQNGTAIQKKIASVFLESFLFYSGFFTPLWYLGNNKLPNIAEIIKLILRDEASLAKQGISRLLKKFSSYKLLILDEWLLDSLSDEQQHFLFELIERRHDCSSTIFCTQFKKDEWHARLGGGVHADAMMDRIVHNAIWVFSGTLNMRKYLANVNNPFES